MKTIIIKTVLVGLFFASMPTVSNAQGIFGSWWYDNEIGMEVSIKSTTKSGNNIHFPKEVCNGYIAVSENYEYFLMLSIKLQKKISDTEYVYTAWGEDSRGTGTYSANPNPVKCRGTITVKLEANRLLLSGNDANGRKWPFNGYYLERSE